MTLRIPVCGVRGTRTCVVPNPPSVLGLRPRLRSPTWRDLQSYTPSAARSWCAHATAQRPPAGTRALPPTPANHLPYMSGACSLWHTQYGVRCSSSTVPYCNSGRERRWVRTLTAARNRSRVLHCSEWWQSMRRRTKAAHASYARAMAATVTTTTAPQNHRTWCGRTARPAPRDATQCRRKLQAAGGCGAGSTAWPCSEGRRACKPSPPQHHAQLLLHRPRPSPSAVSPPSQCSCPPPCAPCGEGPATRHRPAAELDHRF